MQIIGREEFEKDVYGITILPSQEFSYSFIYSGTIEDNICFGVDEQDRNKDRIKEATRIAYANEFIDLLPEGYQTIVGNRESNFQEEKAAVGDSNGNLLDPPVLIFDEATSSLDANSERKIQNAIDSPYMGKEPLS